MNKTKYVYLSGKGAWMHRLFELDDFRGTKSWNMTLYLDPKSWQTFKAEGLQNKVKEDDEGKFISLRRPLVKPWKARPGEPSEFEAPIVRMSDGDLWDDNGPLLGNGSKVTVKLEVFNTRLGKGSRLAEVRVDELVEYVKPEDSGEAADNVRPF